MSLINMGISYDEAEKSSSNDKKGFAPVDAGDYEVTIEKLTERFARTGRPMLAAQFSIINHPLFTNRKLFRDMPLPYKDDTGQYVTSGSGIIASMCKAAGVMWAGTDIETNDLLGLTLRVRVSTVPIVRNGEVTTDLKNEITRFLV